MTPKTFVLFSPPDVSIAGTACDDGVLLLVTLNDIGVPEAG